MTHRDIVVIGASPGGVPALQELVSYLPAALDATVLIVLHIPIYGDTRLPKVLSRAGVLPVALAEDGAKIERVEIYVAPNDRHLVVQGTKCALPRTRAKIGCALASTAIEFGLVDVDQAVDNALWDAIRAIEERAIILREMAALGQEMGGVMDVANQRASEADESQQRTQKIRELVVGTSN
jgi:two-component system chemotaxis response regulator CheB